MDWDTLRYSPWDTRAKLGFSMRTTAVRWEPRAKRMASAILKYPEVRCVLDLGCGMMGLKKYLPGLDYHGYDLQHTPEVQVTDLSVCFPPEPLPGEVCSRALVSLGFVEWLSDQRCLEVLAWMRANSTHMFVAYYEDQNRAKHGGFCSFTQRQFRARLAGLGKVNVIQHEAQALYHVGSPT